MMSNLADKPEEVTMYSILHKDFMAIVCFSIIGIPQYVNIIKIVMNGLVLKRADLINKLTATR